ncbi:hypothetical protein H0E87_016272 [Populus deltoides]|uniref:Uncharacterized protein n=1 Tax=Populus deltoides TaxID=3696 RepID=A0A8T2Y8C7_POPDE|nr:hypothetical protein H0E87_016272 [Populus deltoides]
MDRSPFLLKKVADDDLSICDVMLGKDIKLTKLGIWGCTCGTKIDDDAFHCVLAYTDHRYQNSFSKQNFWYGSIPEKGKKQKQNAVQFPDLGTLLRVNVCIFAFFYKSPTLSLSVAPSLSVSFPVQILNLIYPCLLSHLRPNPCYSDSGSLFWTTMIITTMTPMMMMGTILVWVRRGGVRRQ